MITNDNEYETISIFQVKSCISKLSVLTFNIERASSTMDNWFINNRFSCNSCV